MSDTSDDMEFYSGMIPDDEDVCPICEQEVCDEDCEAYEDESYG